MKPLRLEMKPSRLEVKPSRLERAQSTMSAIPSVCLTEGWGYAALATGLSRLAHEVCATEVNKETLETRHDSALGELIRATSSHGGAAKYLVALTLPPALIKAYELETWMLEGGRYNSIKKTLNLIKLALFDMEEVAVGGGLIKYVKDLLAGIVYQTVGNLDHEDDFGRVITAVAAASVISLAVRMDALAHAGAIKLIPFIRKGGDLMAFPTRESAILELLNGNTYHLLSIVLDVPVGTVNEYLKLSNRESSREIAFTIKKVAINLSGTIGQLTGESTKATICQYTYPNFLRLKNELEQIRPAVSVASIVNEGGYMQDPTSYQVETEEVRKVYQEVDRKDPNSITYKELMAWANSNTPTNSPCPDGLDGGQDQNTNSDGVESCGTTLSSETDSSEDEEDWEADVGHTVNLKKRKFEEYSNDAKA